LDYLDLDPIRNIRGTIKLPGSKSISNRILLLAALARGKTLIRDALESDDTRYMLEALRALGVEWQRTESRSIEVSGISGSFPVKSADLFLGNAGTAFRPLTAALAFSQGHYTLKGVPRMHERPIGDLVDALASLGADITYLGNPAYPPLAIRPAALRVTGHVSVRGDVSSQFLTALLMALPLLGSKTIVAVQGELISKPYVEITLNMMRKFGVDVTRSGWSEFIVHPTTAYLSPGELYVEGDASSASYFLAAGAISGLKGGGPVRVEGVGRDSIQGDVRFADALSAMGAKIEMGPNWISSGAGEAAHSNGKLKAIDADLNHIPDAAMTLAVVALFADGASVLRNIGSWRVKETDRISAMATELRKLGATVEEGVDWLKIVPPPAIRPAAIDTYEDHRMAMCFSLAALGGVTIRINDPGCVAKTFPDYFSALASLAEY
jgi:3-phosphoshikimate 1-carboxyvinyltransferase